MERDGRARFTGGRPSAETTSQDGHQHEIHAHGGSLSEAEQKAEVFSPHFSPASGEPEPVNPCVGPEVRAPRKSALT
jgi:hypothetical protein